MEKVDLTFILYDEMAGGNYISKNTGYRIDDNNVLLTYDGIIVIASISIESEYNGIIILEDSRSIWIHVDRVINLDDISNPTIIEFGKYLIELEKKDNIRFRSIEIDILN